MQMNTTGPSVALSRTGRSFVVAYGLFPLDSGPNTQVTEVSTSDTIVVRYTTGRDSLPAISIDGNGYYFLTYNSNDVSGDSNIFLAVSATCRRSEAAPVPLAGAADRRGMGRFGRPRVATACPGPCAAEVSGVLGVRPIWVLGVTWVLGVRPI